MVVQIILKRILVPVESGQIFIAEKRHYYCADQKHIYELLPQFML